MRTIPELPGIHRLTQGDARAACDAADEIGTDADNLLCCIGFETAGTWNPAEPNHAGSGCLGLIQFDPQNAEALGTSTDKLRAMSFQEQLPWVVKYFVKWHRGAELDTLHGLYLAILWPAASNEADDHVLFSAPSKRYLQNVGFDKPGANGHRKGWVTRGDVCQTIDAFMSRANGKPRLGIPDDDTDDDGPLRTVDELRALATPTPPPPPVENAPPPADVAPCDVEPTTADDRAVLVEAGANGDVADELRKIEDFAKGL